MVPRYDARADLVAFTILRSCNDGLAHRSPASAELLVGVLVFLFSTQVGFIYFHRPSYRLKPCSQRFLVRWHVCHAVFCVTPISRCSFMLEMPLIPVVIR